MIVKTQRQYTMKTTFWQALNLQSKRRPPFSGERQELLLQDQ